MYSINRIKIYSYFLSSNTKNLLLSIKMKYTKLLKSSSLNVSFNYNIFKTAVRK